MKTAIQSTAIAFLIFLFSNCAGIKYMTVETREPAQITLPENVRSVIVVNNVSQQPNDVGHNNKMLGRSDIQRVEASADSVSIYYTEALSQFLQEEEYFNSVLYLREPLRDDKDFFQEKPIAPATMNEIRSKTGADAIISLDKLILQTNQREHYRHQGYAFADMTGKVNSTLRVYLPTMEGKIPAVQYTDSLRWEGFDIQDGNAYSELMLPSREEAMKQLVVRAAEKMTYVFSPHWVMQDRWYYTLPNSLAREAENYVKTAQWQYAVEKWETFYNSTGNEKNKAKVATNIALAYEMLDDMEKAYEWATISHDLFKKTTATSSLERRRSLIYMNEVNRRRDNSNKLNMQVN